MATIVYVSRQDVNNLTASLFPGQCAFCRGCMVVVFTELFKRRLKNKKYFVSEATNLNLSPHIRICETRFEPVATVSN